MLRVAKMSSKERDISTVLNKPGEAAFSLPTDSTDSFSSSVCIVPFHGSQYKRFCCLVLLHCQHCVSKAPLEFIFCV